MRAQLKQYAGEQSKATFSVKATGDINSKFVSSFKPGGGQSAQKVQIECDGAIGAAEEGSAAQFPDGTGASNAEGDDVEWVDGYESLRSKTVGGSAADNGSSSTNYNNRREGVDDDDELQWELPENSGDLSPEVLAALPAHIRKSLIEEARRRQRMASRAHYLPVAGNPALYSQTQLSNFLSSRYLYLYRTVTVLLYIQYHAVPVLPRVIPFPPVVTTLLLILSYLNGAAAS